MRAQQNVPPEVAKSGRLTGGLLSLFGLILLFALFRWGFESGPAVSHPGNWFAPTQVIGLWFNGGSLLGTSREGNTVTILRWLPKNSRPIYHDVDLARFTPNTASTPAAASTRDTTVSNPRVRGAGLDTLDRAAISTLRARVLANRLIRQQTATGIVPSPVPGGASPRPQFPFAVSRGGDRIAWIAGQKPSRLLVASLSPGPKGSDSSLTVLVTDTVNLGQPGDRQVAFTDSGQVWVHDRSGSLHHLFDGSAEIRGQVPAGMTMRVIGNRIVLLPTPERGPPAKPQLVVVDAADSNPKLRFYTLETGAQLFPSYSEQQAIILELPVAISEIGHIAIGTPTGEIIHVTGDTSEAGPPDSVMAAPGAVRAMTFLNDRRLLVAGDFRGVHMLSPGRGDQELADAPIGTDFLTVSDDRIAWAGPGGVTLAHLGTTRTPKPLAIALGITLAIIGFSVAIRKRLRRKARDLEMESAAQLARQALSASGASVYLPKPPPPPPAPLIHALQRGDCILIAGSELGAQAGLPTWPEFVGGLADYGKQISRLSEAGHESVLQALLNGNVTAAAESLGLELSTKDFRDYVTQVFTGAQPSSVHKALGKLPFAGAVTTNFDTLLDKAFSGRDPVKVTTVETDANAASGLLSVVRENRFFLLNMLGRVDAPSTLTFTPRPYRDTLTKDLALRQLLRSLFERYTVFFLGLGLTAIRDFLEAIEITAASGETKHFALVGQSTPIESAETSSLEKKYGIAVLGFIPQHGWPEVAEFVDQLGGGTLAAPVESTRDRPCLSRLVLKDIGPFESLDLTLSEGWNVLLGDNGVGKSIILRAIAAALSGQEAPKAAVSRLLRSGAKKGTIDVYVRGSPTPYTVELAPDLADVVQLQSASLSPLRLGNWLVIGFPALRAMTYVAPPDHPPPAMPSAADLVALMNNDPDTRLTDLKAWLIGLKHQAAEGNTTDARLCDKLFNRFFEVLKAITPDAGIVFKRVDTKKKQIWIETNGALVQLEAVSQGTASVLCWVGVMLQRAYEVHAKLENPETGPVLVLVDEIDAHMHPSWQRIIAPTLRGLFPTLQVLATTHSPMIIGTMTQDQIFVAARRDGKVIVEQFQITPRGMRADQVLTSPLFHTGSPQVDPDTDRMTEDYTNLVSRDPQSLSPEDIVRLAKATAYLKKATISPHDRHQAITAYEVLGNAVRQQLKDMSPEQMKEIELEVKATMVESSAPTAKQS